MELKTFMDGVKAKNPNEPEFHQAVEEVAMTLIPFINEHPEYEKAKILERIAEPERVIMFRVPWVDDQGEIQINRGYRIQMNSAIGPYKGGLRFHPTVNLGVLKFLAFEQVFKNSLTTLPMGGAKGGADFDPVGKSEGEIMRFCQAFMNELYRHIGPDLDVPAGDIGTGAREIGYLFGQYKKIRNEFTGVLTGKGLSFGGSLIRPEATGYGLIYFLDEMLKQNNDSLEGKTVAVSGYGNVGTFAIEKVNELGGKVVTIADEHGYVYDPDGIQGEKLDYLKDLWVVYRKSAKDFADKYHLQWVPGQRPWYVPCDIALPTATQNELQEEHAKELVKNGVKYVAEGANMPSTNQAIKVFQEANINFAPGKAANAGGVATSGLEMCQNSMRYNWTREEVDEKLHRIMKDIYANAYDASIKAGEEGNLVVGANIAGFIKVADAMMAQGV